MKIAISIYPDDLAEADRVLHALKQLRNIELDNYMGKQHVEKVLDKPRVVVDEPADEDLEGVVANPTSSFNTRPNINPGEPTIGKIGENTKAMILADMPWNSDTKYEQHLRLLWKRGLCKYDGEQYYL